jgi:diguanylate cyclase (GGDEF)-like protein
MFVKRQDAAFEPCAPASENAVIAPSLPSNEADRLRALARYKVLDSEPQAAFDKVTEFIAAICEVPMAVVSLVDTERQWFKSRVGIAASETPRDVSFCGHAILEPHRLMIVPDALQDERFIGNPLVTGDLHVRFYAGTPLLSSDGHALGTLCVLDNKPRTMTSRQMETLRLAGEAVQLLLEQGVSLEKLEQAFAQLAFASSHDSLTQLPNRSAVMARMTQALERFHSKAGGRFAVSFIDLDRFKRVNDTLGHPAGDELLVEVARRLSAIVRPCDTVARLGGDEFMMIIEGAASLPTVDALTKRVVSTLDSKFFIRGVALSVTASVGVVLVDETYTSVEDIVRDADIAMYVAKDRGRNRSTIFTKHLRDLIMEANGKHQALRQALDRDEFVLAYQPILSLRDPRRRPVAFEALLRWRQGDDTLMPAAQFIETAEQAGMIVELGYWVMREACAQARRWQTQAGPAILTTVNVSPTQLAEAGFAAAVKRIVREAGVDPSLLAIELTESFLIAQSSLAVVAELRGFGMKIHIDDFGTGYSSLSYLRKFPVDRIKIDRSFVSGVTDDLTDPIIVNAIISLAHRLGVEVVAEGVETERQLAALVEVGCDEAQGFLFSKALPAREAQRFVTRDTDATP